MKKLPAIVLCLMLTVSLIGCTETIDEKTEIPASQKTEDVIDADNLGYLDTISEACIDTASLDIDNDGIKEDCYLSYGPTSGLFTIIITACENGSVKYKNTFVIDWGEVSFGEKEGVPYLVRDDEYHKLYVEDRRIVIDNLDPEFESYWGDSEWNNDLG